MAKKTAKGFPMTAREKAFYLKGKADGALNPDEVSTQLIKEVLDTLIRLSGAVEAQFDRVSTLQSSVSELTELVHEMTELIQIEDESEDDFDSDDEDEWEDELDADEAGYGDLNEDDEDQEDALPEEDYEMDCPACGRTILINPDVDINSVTCPACGSFLGDLPLDD